MLKKRLVTKLGKKFYTTTVIEEKEEDVYKKSKSKVRDKPGWQRIPKEIYNLK